MKTKRFTKNIRLAPQTYALLLKQKQMTDQPMSSLIHRALLAYLSTAKDDSLENRLMRLEHKLMQIDLTLTRARNRIEYLYDSTISKNNDEDK